MKKSYLILLLVGLTAFIMTAPVNAAEKLEQGKDRTTVVLTSSLVPEPLYFRYAWARNPLENLKSADNVGLPFDTQRNDTWSLADMYGIYTGKKTKAPGVLDRPENNELIKALKAEDLKRQIEDAKALLKANNITE